MSAQAAALVAAIADATPNAVADEIRFDPSSGAGHAATREIDEGDRARADEYALLAALLARPPEAAFLEKLAEIRGDASPLGMAHVALAQAATIARPELIAREHFDLFVGVGRGELLPYGSYYLTGFLNERPLARLRDDLRALGIARAASEIEPEDNAFILCEIMAGLAGGKFPASAELQHIFFDKHLLPWMGRFFADLEKAKHADFYRHVGTIGRIFIEIETQAFAFSS